MSAHRELGGALLILAFFATAIAAATSGACVSQGPRFPEFALSGQAPRKSVKGPDDLSLCRIYKAKTCCRASQTQHALGMLKNLAVHGEASSDCLAVWEVLECSICDPRVGTMPGPPTLCSEFCDTVFEACKAAFFFMNVPKQILYPCGPNDILCARGKEWTTNSTRFCKLAGFQVLNAVLLRTHEHPAACFDGKPAAETKQSDKLPSPARKEQYDTLKEAFRRIHRRILTDNVSWAIGGLVLTAGGAYFRQRGLRARQRRKALFKTIHEVRARQQREINNNVTAK